MFRKTLEKHLVLVYVWYYFILMNVITVYFDNWQCNFFLPYIPDVRF
jgi:hypothetical protein